MSTDRGHFLPKKQLHPSEVYCATIGAFEMSGFRLVDVIYPDVFFGEKARVYRDGGGKLHILYYPGKDNENNRDTESPLGQLIKDVDGVLKTKKYKNDLLNAQKHFIVCESNRYFGFKVNHFIKAGLKNGVITTEDSIDRDYDVSYIEQAIQESSSNPSHIQKIKRGWQKSWKGDDWQCGHFVIAAMGRDISPPNPPVKSLEITDRLVDDHFALYELGSKSLRKERDKRVDDSGTFPEFKVYQDSKGAGPIAVRAGEDFMEDDLRIYDQPEEGFFKKYPVLGGVLTGFGVALVVGGITAIIALTWGAATPVVFAAASSIVGAELSGWAALGAAAAIVASASAIVGGVLGKLLGSSSSKMDQSQEQDNGPDATKSSNASKKQEGLPGTHRRLSIDYDISPVAAPEVLSENPKNEAKADAVSKASKKAAKADVLSDDSDDPKPSPPQQS